MTLSRRIAEHMATVRFGDLPPKAVTAAKRSLLDALGVMLAASRMGEGVAAFTDIARQAGPGPSSVLGCGFAAPPMMAAFANGAMAHALDYEDSHDAAPIHPNAALVPAVLALAQANGVDGQTVLTALAAGCDLSCRIATSLTTDIAEAGWYPPPILGALGAAAGCARLLGLDADGVAATMSLILCQISCSGEIKVSPHTQLRAVRDAFPAQAAVAAALLAARGIRGFEAPLEGKSGFFRLFADGRFDADRLVDRLGGHWLGSDISFKPWPSCRGTHAAIEAALALRTQVDPAGIEEIVLTISPVQTMLCLPRAQRLAPATAIDAKFSLPFTVAQAFIHGDVTLDSFDPAARADAAVLALAARVRHQVDESMTMTAAGVEVAASDGRRLAQKVDVPLGHPSHPVSDERLQAKFQDCAARAVMPVSAARARQAIDAVWRLDQPGATLLPLFAAINAS